MEITSRWTIAVTKSLWKISFDCWLIEWHQIHQGASDCWRMIGVIYSSIWLGMEEMSFRSFSRCRRGFCVRFGRRIWTNVGEEELPWNALHDWHLSGKHMYSKFYSPNIIATGSSEINQSSYSVYHKCLKYCDIGGIQLTYCAVCLASRGQRCRSSCHWQVYIWSSWKRMSSRTPNIHWKSCLIHMTRIWSSQPPEFVSTDLSGNLTRSWLRTFFGNVQNVEVDGMKGHEDLGALSRLAGNLTGGSVPQKPVHSSSTGMATVSKQYPQHQHRVGALKVVHW